MVAHQSTPPGHSSRFYPNLLVHKLRASSLVHSQALHACLSNSCIASDNLNATCNFFFIIVDVRPERPIRLQLSCHIHFEWFFFSTSQGAAATSAQMGLANIGGVFIVLLGGMIVSCIIAVVEYAWGKRMLLQDENVRMI